MLGIRGEEHPSSWLPRSWSAAASWRAHHSEVASGCLRGTLKMLRKLKLIELQHKIIIIKIDQLPAGKRLCRNPELCIETACPCLAELQSSRKMDKIRALRKEKDNQELFR